MNARALAAQRRFEIPMLVAALLVIPTLILDDSSHGPLWDAIGVGLDWTTWLAFLVEAVVMLWLVDSRRRWLREHPIEVIVLVLTPPFLGVLFASLRLLRLLRVTRLLRLGSYVHRIFSGQGLKYAALATAVFVLAAGEAFASIEPGVGPGNGIYWAITTMTTVGYGDVPITTSGGKVLAIVVMLFGIGFVALLTGAVAERFLGRDMAEQTAAVDALGDDEVEILAELRQIQERMATLEQRLNQRLQSAARA
jgi:voltage-gated potassium channel